MERAEAQASVAIWVRRVVLRGCDDGLLVVGGWMGLGVAHEGGDGGHCCGFLFFRLRCVFIGCY